MPKQRHCLSFCAALALACAPLPEPDFPISQMPLAALRAPRGSPQEGFFVPCSEDPKQTGKLLHWLLSPNEYDRTRAPVVPRLDNDGATLAGRENSASISWVDHATFAVHDAGDVLLTDPHFGDRALIPERRQVLEDRGADPERVRVLAVGERWHVPERGRS